MKQAEEMTFAEIYGIAAKEYVDTPTTALPFSVRVINRFMGNGITTAAALFETTPEQLANIKGFGKTCLDEVHAFCATLQTKPQSTSILLQGSVKNVARFRIYAEQIAVGDFSFLSQAEWSEDECLYADALKEAYDALGSELAQVCIASPERVVPVIDMLSDFQEKSKPYQEIHELLWLVPAQRRSKKAAWYIKAFTINDEERQKLLGLCNAETTTIAELAARMNVNDIHAFLLTKKFLKWCAFDLNEEIQYLLDKLHVNDRARIVIELRAAGQTLEQVGNVLGVTRERVRQIEMKVKRTFTRLHSRIRIISKVAAERNGDTVLSPAEISRFCGNSSTELLYLLQSYEGTNYTYDKQLDVFIVGDDSLHDRVDAYLEALPNIVAADQFEQLTLTAEEDESIPREMFEKAFFESYRKTGAVYHRSRLSLAIICRDILDKHFPEGMHVYDPVDIAKFREFVVADYGDVRLPENDRALTARISGVGILCGRGMYRAKKKQYMPKVLLEKIYEYIASNDSQVFLTGSLFNIFEEDLLAAGVDNRYYLQGILHEVFADKFTFRRDYISKDANITSVYTAIVNFINKAKYPVSKLQIQNEFPGITDIVIALAVSDPEVLNYFGEYLHASNLHLTDTEQQYLYDVVSRIVSDNMSHHVKDFYEVISREKPEILTRNAILYPFGAYSLLEYLFREQFQFLRPYVASIGTEIGRAGERLKELIYSTDRISIADIRDFAKENRFQIQSMIDYANACNDEFLLVDKDTLMRIDKIQITETTAKQIEDCVAQAVTQTTPIYQLSVWKVLPALSVPWTDWLLYSVLNKWATKVSVGTSSNQMKMAVPLVAPAGELNTTALGDTAMIGSAATIKFDDLDNIDELLEDIIGEDIWEDPYEL